jgi:hypothetical protein
MGRSVLSARRMGNSMLVAVILSLSLLMASGAVVAAPLGQPTSTGVQAANCGTAWAFLDEWAASGAGHVAWGFSSPEITPRAIWGSVDGQRESSTNKKSWMFRADSIDSMVANMRRRGYSHYAFKTLDNCNIWNGLEKADDVSVGKYELIGANCLDATYDVLLAFGMSWSDMPTPFEEPAPRFWFGALKNTGWSIRAY